MLRARTWFIFTALAASLLVRAASAADFEEKRFYLTPFVGGTFFDSERKFSTGADLPNDMYYGGRAGVRLSRLVWADLAGGYTNDETCCDWVDWMHFSGNVMLSPASLRTFNPFISVGGGWERLKHSAGAAEEHGTAEGAVGLRVRLSDAFGLRLEGRSVLALPHSNYTKAHLNDIVAGAGLTYAFGGKRVVDSDGDGVPDDKDACPNTPRGCRVDARGCPIDSDGDGVCDGLDQCPNTPHGCQVDAKGCPIDSDRDGVCDGLDQCPNTPSGCKVDARGCPTDSDGDGVCDELDNCPNTPVGCQVDAHGCPIDSDGDGVCDGLDKCPNTPAGTTVDKDGCPVVDREKQLEQELLDTGMIRLSNVNFDYDKATIRPDAYAVLDTVGRVLTKWPGLKIEIGGHTDSRGSDAYNRALSQRRAASVRAYLLAHFQQFKPAQITSKGYGESKPIAPNTSPANMQLNRRVEFVVLNREVLRQNK
jgi:OOP family OmpA-OmpF porin